MKKVCGVNQNMFREYNFNDHTWAQNAELRADLLHLAQRCVKIGSQYWFKKVGGSCWMPIPTITDAEKEALNTWLGAALPSGNAVTAALINTFFHGEETLSYEKGGKTVTYKAKTGSCPNIFQKMVVPMGPQYVTYNNQTMLNTWYWDGIDGDVSHLQLGKLVLLMCYGALCNGQVNLSANKIGAEADRVYDMVVTDNYDNVDFRFLMNWLAAIVQFPGINLQTNVWLLGSLEGIGKGTLVNIMRIILGPEFVGELNQTEVEAGWNDHLIGKVLIEVNEFETTGKMSGKQWGTWLKGNTIEPTFRVRERNTRAYTVLHIGNFLGTGNVSGDQDFLDSEDRRNQTIETSKDPRWVQFATAIQLQHLKKHPKEVASGFAHVLETVKVNLDFIAKANKNQLKMKIAKNNQTIVDEWIGLDFSIKRGVSRPAIEWYESFKYWWKDAHPSDPTPSLTKFGKAMGSSERIGVVKEVTSKGSSYTIGDPPVIVEAKLEDAVLSVKAIAPSNDVVAVFDYDEEESKEDFSGMTQLDKMRAFFRSEKE